MNKIDAATLDARVKELADVFDKRSPSPGAMEVWFETLKEFSIHDVASCLIAWPKRNAKMPTPADVWKLLNDERSERIEREAAVNKARHRHEAERAFVASGRTGQLLRELAEHLKPETRDPKAWARRIVRAYVECKPLRVRSMGSLPPALIGDGEISDLQLRYACEALKMDVNNVRAEREVTLQAMREVEA